MASIPGSVRELVESGPLVHCVTLNRDGSPQVTAVWLGIEGGEFVMAHLGAWQKVRNARRDPRVALPIEGHGTAPNGLKEYLVIHGREAVQDGGAPELLQRLARTYLGPDVTFPPMENPPPGYVLRISPERYTGNGPWTRRFEE